MYSVSNEYLTAMMSPSVRRRVSGYIGGVAFTEDDIVANTLSITNNAATESDFKIGGVNMGELELTFVPSFLSKVARTEYQDKEVSISIGLYITVIEEWVDVPCGVFTLQAPKISKDGVAVVGYDNMHKLDKGFGYSTVGGQIYDMLSMICRDCHVELGMTQAQIEALPNGTDQLAVYSENDIETYRDFLYWIAQTTGRFATFNREGKLELRKFGTPTGVTIDEMHRDIDVVFSGYTTHYTGVSFVDMEQEMTHYYAVDPDDGLTMNLGKNPLVQYGTDEVVDAQRIAILNEVADIEYTPFTFTSIRDCIFDLGDEIQFTGGISAGCTGCLMGYTFNLNSYQFEGYGDDPALATARNKVDKNISGLASKSESNTIYYYSYENITDIVVPDNAETEIAYIQFAAKKVTDIIIQCEFKINLTNNALPERTTVYHDEEIPDDQSTPEDESEIITTEIGYFDKVETPMVVHVLYYYDGVLVDYQPVQTWMEDGYHTFSGFYHMKEVDIEQAHDWSVRLLLDGADGTIAIGDSHLLVTGQGLINNKKELDNILAQDQIPLVDIGALTIVPCQDSAEVKMFDYDSEHSTDEQAVNNAPSINIGNMSVISAEDHQPSIVLANIVFGFITDDGDNIVTEDEQYYLCTDENTQ